MLIPQSEGDDVDVSAPALCDGESQFSFIIISYLAQCRGPFVQQRLQRVIARFFSRTRKCLRDPFDLANRFQKNNSKECSLESVNALRALLKDFDTAASAIPGENNSFTASVSEREDNLRIRYPPPRYNRC